MTTGRSTRDPALSTTEKSWIFPWYSLPITLLAGSREMGCVSLCLQRKGGLRTQRGRCASHRERWWFYGACHLFGAWHEALEHTKHTSAYLPNQRVAARGGRPGYVRNNNFFSQRKVQPLRKSDRKESLKQIKQGLKVIDILAYILKF